jgi:hypothetical protein
MVKQARFAGFFCVPGRERRDNGCPLLRQLPADGAIWDQAVSIMELTVESVEASHPGSIEDRRRKAGVRSACARNSSLTQRP